MRCNLEMDQEEEDEVWLNRDNDAIEKDVSLESP